MMLICGRNSIRFEEWRLERIEIFSEFAKFDCGRDDLNDFIRNDAGDYQNELMTVTYAFRLMKENRVSAPFAFVSLANDLIPLKTNRQKRPIPNKMRGHSPPATKICRLGVHQEYQGQKLGSKILDCLKYLFTTENRTGCRFLTVDAYNEENVTSFYSKNDFQFLSEDDRDDDTRIMFCDLKRFTANLTS